MPELGDEREDPSPPRATEWSFDGKQRLGDFRRLSAQRDWIATISYPLWVRITGNLERAGSSRKFQPQMVADQG